MDTGLLLLRLVLGGILFVHGMQKAAGWFSGPGLTGAEALFSQIGQEPAGLKVRLAIGCEVISGASLILGIATPFGAAVAASTMLVAGASLTLVARKVWLSSGGGEYPLVLAMVALGLGFTGPGNYSFDSILGLETLIRNDHLVVGLVVAAVAILGAIYPALSTRRVLIGRGSAPTA